MFLPRITSANIYGIQNYIPEEYLGDCTMYRTLVQIDKQTKLFSDLFLYLRKISTLAFSIARYYIFIEIKLGTVITIYNNLQRIA